MNKEKIITQGNDAFIMADGIVVINPSFQIVVFNEAAARITGYTEDNIIGRNFSLLFHDDYPGDKYIRRSFTEAVTYTNLSYSVRQKNGLRREVIVSFIPVINDSRVLSVVFLFRDKNEMSLLSKSVNDKANELSDERNRLDAIFNSSIEGTFTINNDWVVTAFNKSAENITGYSSEEVIGRHCWEIFRHLKCRNGCHMEATMEKGKSAIGVEIEILTKTGDAIPVRINSAILKDSSGNKTGAVETFIDLSEVKRLSAELNEKYKFGNIVGNGKEASKLRQLLESVASTSSTVLITGESGTGKELVAKAIHAGSRFAGGPFIAVNCSAFAETLIESELFGHEAGAFTGALKSKPGRFEMAEGGTLFIDEIGDLSPLIQTKLLRVIENREFERVGGTKSIKLNTRIIAATNKDLQFEIEAGRFREDFYYRINVFNIHIPPLRHRKEDIPQLVNHFIQKFNRVMEKNVRSCSSEMMEILMDYNWPGNIRELENVIEHAFILCSSNTLNAGDLPQKLITPLPYKIYPAAGFRDSEKERLLYFLDIHGWNRGKTAAALNINPSTLWRKMKKYGLV